MSHLVTVVGLVALILTNLLSLSGSSGPYFQSSRNSSGPYFESSRNSSGSSGPYFVSSRNSSGSSGPYFASFHNLVGLILRHIITRQLLSLVLLLPKFYPMYKTTLNSSLTIESL